VTVREAVAQAANVPLADVGTPEDVWSQGDVSWYIVPLADGRWTTTDDSDVMPNRVTIHPTREEAVAELAAAAALFDPRSDYAPKQVRRVRRVP
jgi:hypothetical protein